MCTSTGFENATFAACALIFSESKDMFAKSDKWLYKRGCVEALMAYREGLAVYC